MNKLIIGLIAGVVAAVGMYALIPRTVTVEAPPAGATPTINSPLCIEGLCKYFISQSMRTATTTVCAMKTPPATTTVVKVTANFLVGSTSAKTISITKGTSMQATTTALNDTGMALAANAQGTFVSSSTPANETALVIGPSQWIQVSMVGGRGTDSPTGKCNAELIAVQ